MLRRSLLRVARCKPISGGYAASLLPAVCPPHDRWHRAMDGNSDVRAFFTPNAERYDAWYKETYGIDDLSDGCAASGASSNKRLDDAKNMHDAATLYDTDAVAGELDFWASEFGYDMLIR